jgi:hypothetical protein
MKLTRKLAIEMALSGVGSMRKGFDDSDCIFVASRGVDLGIVLGLQMALEDNPSGYDKPSSYEAALQRMIARHLKKLEKAK